MKNLRKITVTATAVSVFYAFLSLAFIAGRCSASSTTAGSDHADRIVVEKSARTMTLMHGGKVLKAHRVALSRDPVGAKQREVDHKVPEGEYVVVIAGGQELEQEPLDELRRKGLAGRAPPLIWKFFLGAFS